MRQPFNVIALLALGFLVLLTAPGANAQGYDTPLTIQGMNNATTHSVASRAAGGITFGVKNDVSIMFTNPALLQSLSSPQISFGYVQQSTYTKQDQLYGGLQTHSAFAPLVEGVTDWISDPDTILSPPPTASDTVQRPFDKIGPNWNRTKNKTLPLEAFVGVPFTLQDVRFVAGLGVVEYANLNRFYQNNNSFSPSVLSVLNGTIGTGALNTNPFITQWFQYTQERSGSIYGYGLALSAAPLEDLSLGVSSMYVKGSTNDLEARVGRGMMAFYNNYLRLSKKDVLSYTKTGTSDYSGTEFTIGASYHTKRFDVGFSLKPPMTITRSYTSQTAFDSVTTLSRRSHRVDSLHATWSTSLSGEDKVKFPWRGTVGLAINVREDLTVGLEYEVRSYASALYTSAEGTESNPWLSASLWHFGVEYRPAEWLSLRGGVRENAEVYEPLSNPIRGEAVKYTVYTFGAGFSVANLRLGLAYEYADMKYVDTWSNAASINREFRQNVVASVSYSVPW
jgi:opacity protein-like surface antigen